MADTRPHLGHHEFRTGQPMLASGNTAVVVSPSSFAPPFTVVGDTSITHSALLRADLGLRRGSGAWRLLGRIAG